MDKKKYSDNRGYRDRPFEYDFELNEEEGNQGNIYQSQEESVPYLQNDNKLMDRIAEFRRAAKNMKSETSLNISNESPTRKNLNRSVAEQRGMQFSQYHDKKEEKNSQRDFRSLILDDNNYDSFKSKNDYKIKESELIANSKKYNVLEDLHSPARSNKSDREDRLKQFNSYRRQKSVDKIKDSDYTSSPQKKSKTIHAGFDYNPNDYGKDSNSISSPQRTSKERATGFDYKQNDYGQNNTYTPGKSIQANNFNDPNTEFITISKAEGKTVQIMLKKYAVLKILQMRTNKHNKSLTTENSQHKLSLNARHTIIGQSVFKGIDFSNNKNNVGGSSFDQANIKQVRDELTYYKKKACELELELQECKRNLVNLEKKEVVTLKPKYDKFLIKDQNSMVDYDDFINPKDNTSLEKSNAVKTKSKKINNIEKMFKNEFLLKRVIFQWIEVSRGINYGNSDFLPSYLFLKWRQCSKHKGVSVNAIHKDLDNQYLNKRWNDEKSVLKKENRYPYSALPKNAVNFEHEIIDWERELLYKRRFKAQFSSIVRNTNRRLKIHMILNFYKLSMNAMKVTIEYGLENYVDQKSEFQTVALKNIIGSLENKLQRLESEQLQHHNKKNKDLNDYNIRVTNQKDEKASEINIEINELRNQLMVLSELDRTSRILNDRKKGSPPRYENKSVQNTNKNYDNKSIQMTNKTIDDKSIKSHSIAGPKAIVHNYEMNSKITGNSRHGIDSLWAENNGLQQRNYQSDQIYDEKNMNKPNYRPGQNQRSITPKNFADRDVSSNNRSRNKNGQNPGIPKRNGYDSFNNQKVELNYGKKDDKLLMNETKLENDMMKIKNMFLAKLSKRMWKKSKLISYFSRWRVYTVKGEMDELMEEFENINIILTERAFKDNIFRTKCRVEHLNVEKKIEQLTKLLSSGSTFLKNSDIHNNQNENPLGSGRDYPYEMRPDMNAGSHYGGNPKNYNDLLVGHENSHIRDKILQQNSESEYNNFNRDRTNFHY